MATEYHNYEQPADGETNWGDILNNVLDEIDADVIEIGGTEPDTEDNVPWIDTGPSTPQLKTVQGGSYELVEAAADLSAIDSDDDGTVDAADTAAAVKGNDIDTDGDGVVNDSDKLAGKTRVEHLIDSPNADLDTANLNAGESSAKSVRVPDGETLTVYAWGVVDIANQSAPSGLVVELVDETGTVDTSENTTWNENTSGVASLANTSGGEVFYRLRATNGTGSDILSPGVGAQFAYIVE